MCWWLTNLHIYPDIWALKMFNNVDTFTIIWKLTLSNLNPASFLCGQIYPASCVPQLSEEITTILIWQTWIQKTMRNLGLFFFFNNNTLHLIEYPILLIWFCKIFWIPCPISLAFYFYPGPHHTFNTNCVTPKQS